jgi:hypothetical protein
VHLFTFVSSPMWEMVMQYMNKMQGLDLGSGSNVEGAAVVQDAPITGTESSNGLITISAGSKLGPQIHLMNNSTCFISSQKLSLAILGFGNVNQGLLDRGRASENDDGAGLLGFGAKFL